MKHFRVLLPLLVLALVLSGCAGTSREPYEVSLDGNRVVTIHPAAGTIRYGEDIYRYSVKTGWNETRYTLTYPDGQRYTWTESRETGTSAWSEGYTPSIYLPGELLVKALKQSAPETPEIPREKKGNPVTGVLCSAAGLLMMVFHKWRANPDNPRTFVSFDGSGSYGVEVTPEQRAAASFVEGAILLIVGLIQFLI